MVNLTPSVALGIHLSDLKKHNWQISQENNKRIVKASSGKSFIRCKNFSYPKLNISNQKNNLSLGYKLDDNEGFSILVKDGKLEITTPHFGQIQLFYLQKDDWFFASDSFAGLVQISKPYINVELNPQGMIEWLTLKPELEETTIVYEAKKLSENKQLVWDGAHVFISHILELKDLVTPFAMTSKINADKNFENHMMRQFNTVKKISGAKKWGSCLSGGTDSAIVSILVSGELPTDTYSVLVSDDTQRQRQQTVTQKICSKLNTSLNEIDANKVPLLEDLDELLLADPYLDPYANWSLVMSEKMLLQNTDIIWAGMGADDFYKSRRNNLKNKKDSYNSIINSKKLGKFFNVTLYKEKTKENLKGKNRVSPLPQGLSNALLFYNTMWRNCGVWPISPFVSKASISFSLYLSAQDKANKQFLKLYVQKKLKQKFPEWKTKIPLSSAFIKSVHEYMQKFTLADINKKIVETNVLNLDKVEIVLQQVKNGNTLSKDDSQFFFLLIKINRFITLLDIL